MKRRVLVDSNVILSALLFPDSVPARALQTVLARDRLALCDYLVEEVKAKVRAKWPDLTAACASLFAALDWERLPDAHADGLIDDPKDGPILGAALSGGVDIILSGDKHFLRLALPRPVCLAPASYLAHVAERGGGQ